MKVKKLVVGCLLLLSAIGTQSLAGASEAKALPGKAADRAQEQRRELAFLVAPIKTAADLTDYLAMTDANSASPFKRLSAPAQRRFVESLTFNEQGVSGFNYQDIEEELTFSQAYQLFALFGIQHVTPRLTKLKVKNAMDSTIGTMNYLEEDYKEYECQKRATCTFKSFNICMSGC